MSGDKYRILRSLNTAGTVTLAESTADGRKYVLKELTEESTPIYRRISELPPQENLMQVHEILRQDGRSTVVCEFVEGQPLDELLDSGRVFPTLEIRRITAQLCRAAEHLHQHGIIHRDITPKNIILDENLNLKLIDFDIARQYSGNREQDTTLYGTEGFAPPGIVRLSETAETEITMESVNTAETETPTTEPTQEQPIETAELPTTEAIQEQTTQTPDLFTSEQSEPVPEITDPTKEEIISQTTESTMEYIPATIESTEPERTPNILSDSINPNKITFETVQDDGLYEDIFDYVFYDDPAVHGEWRLCGILSPDTDFTAITAKALAFTGTFENFVWQYLTVSPDGSYILRDPDKRIIVRSQWTNGYCITFDGDLRFVRRMFEVTVDGGEHLMFEQKPTGNHPDDIPHRFLVYSRIN